MRSKPRVPEVSEALKRRIAAVEEMIAEDKQGRAGEGEPAPAAAPVVEQPAPAQTVEASRPSVAEYAFPPPPQRPPPSIQVNVRVPYDLDEEVRKVVVQFFHGNYTQFVLTAMRHELAMIKEHVHGNAQDASAG